MGYEYKYQYDYRYEYNSLGVIIPPNLSLCFIVIV